MPWRADCYECGQEAPITRPVFETRASYAEGDLGRASVSHAAHPRRPTDVRSCASVDKTVPQYQMREATRRHLVKIHPNWTREPLVALSVLTPATAVYAECAWALWLQRDSSPGAYYKCFQTREGCIEAMSQQVAAAEKRNPRVTLDTIRGSCIANVKEPSLCGQCLPDTIDPRGAKGE